MEETKKLMQMIQNIHFRELKAYKFETCGISFNLKIDIESYIEQIEDLMQYIYPNTYPISDYYSVFCLNAQCIYSEIRKILDGNFYNNEKITIYKDGKGNEKIVNKYSFDNIDINDFVDTECTVIGFNKNIYLIMTSQTKENKRQLLRVIKDIIFRTLENRGYFSFHAAAVSIKGNGVMICGDKGAGKTTLAIHLMLGLNANFITNDRAFIKFAEKCMTIQYFPLSINLGMGTINRLIGYNNFNKLDDLSRYKSGYSIIKEDKSVKLDITKKVRITPIELSKVLNVELIDFAELKYILVPEIIHDSNYAELTEMKEEEFYEVYNLNCFTPNDSNYINPWIVKRNLGYDSLTNEHRKFFKKLIKSVKILKISYGTNTDTGKIACLLKKYIT